MAQLSEILDRLVPKLGELEGEPAALDGGITNRNYVARFGGEPYVVRIPGKDTAQLGVDRGAERQANEAAARVGVGSEVVAVLTDPYCLVTRFIEGETMAPAGLREPAALAAVAAALRALHGSGEEIPSAFSAFRVVEDYAERARSRGGAVPEHYARAHDSAERIETALRHRPHKPVFCHNDLLAANFIRSPAGLRVVDWDYAGMGDHFFDLGNFAVNNELGAAEEEAFLEAYLGEPARPGQLAALRLMRFMSDFREAMWGVLQGSLSDIEFDFAAYAEKHFERLSAAEAEPGFAVMIEEAGGAAG